MRIKEIYIKNFKGVNEKKIITIDSGTTLLIGPNGFGKTTIFDVLELCITGKMYRTEAKQYVTSDIKDYIKPFYQNDITKDVIIKVWLEKLDTETGKKKELIIVRYLNKNNDGRSTSKGKRNKPCDFEILKAFRDNPKTFTDDVFDVENAVELSTAEISDFLNLNPEKQCINDLYHLFNYLQQEETTFFMKKTEKDRKSALGFLLQTSDQEEKYSKINDKYLRLSKIKGKLEEKITEEKGYLLANCPEYEKLFQNKDIPFDQKDLFSGDDSYREKGSQRNEFQQTLDKLINFCAMFDIIEYKKKKKVELLNKLIDDNFMKYYVLSEIISGGILKEQNSYFPVLKDNNKLKKFILQELVENLEAYSDINKKIERYSLIVYQKSFDELLYELDKYFIETRSELSATFKEVLNNRKTIVDTISVTDGMLKEIVQFRKELLIRYKNIESNNHDKTNCPFCGSVWESLKELIDGYIRQEKRYDKLLGEQAHKLLDLDSTIRQSYVDPELKPMKMYLESTKKIDPELINLLNELKEIKINERLNSLDEVKNFIWQEPKEMSELTKSIDNLKNVLLSIAPIDEIVYGELIRLESVDFSEQMIMISELKSEELKHIVISEVNEEKITGELLIHQTLKVQNKLIQLQNKNKYNYVKAMDTNGYFSTYFDSDFNTYESFDNGALFKKKEYIDGRFSLIKSDVFVSLQERLENLSKIVRNLEELKKIYWDTISNYKRDMIDRIKLPFYIYSAKILQNYQQGMGIFLTTNGKSDSIRFLTDSSTDHDAVHHLSSGQLAVTSLAFTLAINKTYRISDELKFLLIDDPIQEMDSLNIHSFVELIRHEFIEDYQLIFSTHNNMNALYIKYKLEKLLDKTVRLINVQTQFFY